MPAARLPSTRLLPDGTPLHNRLLAALPRAEYDRILPYVRMSTVTTGDTLQAVGRHAFAHVLMTPGSLDVTAHVDFEALGAAAEGMGAAVHGPIDQSELLRRLGIVARAAVLKEAAWPEKRPEIEAALARLTGQERTGMGRLFKAMGLADPKLGPLPGFAPE